MAGLGTIVNALAIVFGGLCGLFARGFLKERYQETVTRAMGFAVSVMALGSTLSQMLVVQVTQTADGITAGLDTQGTIMMVISLAVGSLLGELLDECLFQRGLALVAVRPGFAWLVGGDHRVLGGGSDDVIGVHDIPLI